MFVGIEIPVFRGVRRGDHQDVHEYFEHFGAPVRQIAASFGPQAAQRAQIYVPGLINGPTPVHAATRALDEQPGLINGGSTHPHSTFVQAPRASSGDCPTPGDSAHETDPDCPPRQNCGEDALPFNSRRVEGFPVVGNNSFAQATLAVAPKVQEVKPYELYWAAFDVNNGFARLAIAELVSAKIGTEEQLLGPGMVASVFMDAKGRMPLTWKSFTPSLPLELSFGHPLSDTVHMHVWGVLWAEVTRR